MTYAYSNIDPSQALYNSAKKYPGGIKAMAADMNISEGVLRNKLAPACTTHHTNFEEVSEAIDNMEWKGMPEAFEAIHAFCWRHGHVACQLPKDDIDSDDLLKQVVDVMGKQGNLASAIGEALSNKTIDEQEFERIELNIQTCMSALAALRNKVEAKHEADFHKGAHAHG